MSSDQDQTEMLAVALTEAEVATRADELARGLQTYGEVEAEKRLATAGFGRRLKEIRGHLDELAKAVATKTEKRPIPTRTQYDVRRFTVETIREDNGEVVTTRAMTADEVAERNQPGLFERSAMGGKSDDEDGDGAHDYAADEDEREGETVPPAEGPPTEPPDAALTEGSAIDDPAAMLEAAAPDPEATPSRKRRGGLSVVSDKRH